MLRKLALQTAFVFALLLPMTVLASELDVQYSPQVVKDALAEGRAVLLEFSAEW